MSQSQRAVAWRCAKREQLGELGSAGRPAEDVAEPVEEHEGDVEADRQEGDQLDQRLEGDRGDHALVTLGGVEVAGAEHDREGGQQQRDVEGGVLQQGRVGRPSRPGSGRRAGS